MKIVKPFDWQIIKSTDLDVIVDGIDSVDGLDAENVECVLWLKETYFADPANPQPALTRAPLKLFSNHVAYARLVDLKPWQHCIVGVVKRDSGRIYDAVGVILGYSSFTDWLRKTSSISLADIVEYVRYPIKLSSFEMSHYDTNTNIDVKHRENLTDLFINRDLEKASVVILQSSEYIAADTCLISEFCIGLDHKRFGYLLSQSPFQSCPIYFALFSETVIIFPTGLVILDETSIWSDSSYAAFFNDIGLYQHRHLFRAGGEIGLLLDEVGTLADIFAANQIPPLAGIPMPICHSVYHNHGHWIANSLFAAYLLRDQIQAGEVFLLVPEYSRYIVESLMCVGIPRDRILFAKPSSYRLDNVIFPSTISILSNTFPSTVIAGMFAKIRQSITVSAKTTGPERIYITRKGSATQRRISNEDELIEGLRARGFSCVAPHELDFKEEVLIFSNATIIIGQLGAGLANIGFAPPGCIVIEITSNNYTSNDYWFLSSILSHKFIRFLFDSGINEEFTIRDFEFRVPTELALEMVDKIIQDKFLQSKVLDTGGCPAPGPD